MTLEEHEKLHPNVLADWRDEVASGLTTFGLDDWLISMSGSLSEPDRKWRRYRVQAAYSILGSFNEKIYARSKGEAEQRMNELMRKDLSRIESGLKTMQIESITEDDAADPVDSDPSVRIDLPLEFGKSI